MKVNILIIKQYVIIGVFPVCTGINLEIMFPVHTGINVFPVCTGINRCDEPQLQDLMRVPCMHRDKPGFDDFCNYDYGSSLYAQG